jgi:predicted amidophosphoribosyltransferase
MLKDAVLVPVPGDPWRTLVRGIDHAGALARAASMACGWPSRSLLVRHDRVRQASRRAQQRRLMQGRFGLRSKTCVVPDRVVLVDDVCTTGSTGADCAHAIRRAGASWVALGVLARAHR